MTLRIPEYVTWYGHEDGVIVLNVKDRQKHLLNDTAGLLWRRMERSATVADLVDLLPGKPIEAVSQFLGVGIGAAGKLDHPGLAADIMGRPAMAGWIGEQDPDRITGPEARSHRPNSLMRFSISAMRWVMASGSKSPFSTKRSRRDWV